MRDPAREQRLAEALRANLGRRKARARAENDAALPQPDTTDATEAQPSVASAATSSTP